ncbi:MAG: chromosomal replication initiator protein DnaA [Bradymonadales bacterium]|nr:MAG: chromosomal replication initiator protein DnaA [Bradymonadales bacterium]
MLPEKQKQDMKADIPPEMREAWEKALQGIEKEVKPQYFQSFILTIQLLGHKENLLILGFPDQFYANWVHDHYAGLIQEKFDEASDHQFGLEFSKGKGRSGSRPPRQSSPPLTAESLKKSLASSQSPKTSRKSNSLSDGSLINPKYGFETFVVGASNQFAHAASFTVAEDPGKHYNPLFIYGEVGLGKTHLLNAISLKIKEKFPSKRVHYTSFEKFTNHMIESIRFEKMEEFRERYRKSCDVLIIDDIQFISGKERTQEEFFHTFNALYEHQKQIVLSSDRAPKDIQSLEDRLRSRFEMGLIVDIQPPEMETRVAIVYKKAEADGIQLPEDVAFLLAKTFRANIRELEGALLKLGAFASLTGGEVNMELAKKVLKPESQGANQIFKDPEEIMKLVARQFRMSLNDLRSDKKTRELSTPRQLAMFLCRKYSNLSLPDIGTLFGGKNHTTVLHAIRRVGRMQASDPILRESVSKLETEIKELNTL